MEYIFSAANQALLFAGKLVPVYNKAGQLLPILRDPVTGKFVEIAKGVVQTSVNPFLAPIELLSQEELDFLFPEITRIHSQDLPVLQSWQNQVDWIQSLSQEELKQLNSAELNKSEIPDSQETGENEFVLAEPPEQLLYEKLQQKSHFLSLRAQLRFLIKPDLRRNYESFISQQATDSNYKALAPSNWQEISDLTVANLYWYFHKKSA